ncbi:GntR family transcriptional regulator [Actinoplanes sp. SE50]|uniref:FadR/GntR family transcriptional regulator n=1 Tax=unclassified Actinoplanes TaxID=2626549 RepID=UPI00023EBBC0|nr:MULTISPECIES: FadR/GntR family transcriptional regulator [unclassified Actinoplanes]AEV85069.1 GntR family transcriptional regulator [Actinoplanes sp. SE50/110]ATO83460.1 GntR family transcriptional regulator [Actinoplanes sp. SE50]SLM00867.1 GntR family transcriptional regulator [Actinoplanes sp. SE50/110]
MAKVNLADIVVDDHLRRIAVGELRPGDRLPTEPEMCDAYGMSRSAVREAMHKLAGKGFVTVRQGSGTTIGPREQWNELDPDFVRCGSDTDMLRELVEVHLIEARQALEPVTASLAAIRASEDQRRELRALLVEQEWLGDRDADAQAEADIRFHSALARATHNPLIIAMHASLVTLGRRSRTLAAQTPGGVDRAIAWHTHLVEAVEARDALAATDAMRMHLRQVRGDLQAGGPVDAQGAASGFHPQVSSCS